MKHSPWQAGVGAFMFFMCIGVVFMGTIKLTHWHPLGFVLATAEVAGIIAFFTAVAVKEEAQ